MPLQDSHVLRLQELYKQAKGTQSGEQLFVDQLKSQGLTSQDIQRITSTGESTQGTGFSLGGAAGALASGISEGAVGFTPEQRLGTDTAKSGMTYDLPFGLGEVDPVRTAGQVAGAVASPFSKIKTAGKIPFILRTYGPTAVSALQDAMSEDGDIDWDTLVSLFGIETAGALAGRAGKTLGTAQNTKMGQALSRETVTPGRMLQDTRAGQSPQMQRTLSGEAPLSRQIEAPRQRARQAASSPPPQPVQQAQQSSRTFNLPETSPSGAPSEAQRLRSMAERPKRQMRGETRGQTRTRRTTSSAMMEGDQFIDQQGRFMEVIERPTARKQPLKVRDISTGKVTTLPKGTEVEKVVNIEPTDLNFLFGTN